MTILFIVLCFLADYIIFLYLFTRANQPQEIRWFLSLTLQEQKEIYKENN